MFGIDNVVYNHLSLSILTSWVSSLMKEVEVISGPESSYRVYNNTIINSKKDGIVLYAKHVETNDVRNNIVIIEDPVGFDYIRARDSVQLDSSNNYVLKTE